MNGAHCPNQPLENYSWLALHSLWFFIHWVMSVLPNVSDLSVLPCFFCCDSRPAHPYLSLGDGNSLLPDLPYFVIAFFQSVFHTVARLIFLKWNLVILETTPNIWTGWAFNGASVSLASSSLTLLAVLEPYCTVCVLPYCVFNLWTFTHDFRGDSSPSSAFSSCLNLLLFLELKFSCLCSFVWIP